ncbi:hypothetical protein HHI36_008574 [Cryptolaemus montrouzieri]|uniref:Protein anon-73B1 n=1 Tax=Cryptolaemus montrouzieri TaxID=559131 RepID=A0ABD2MSU4_9CUCU
MNAAINIGVEEMTATIVRCGLYLGALFQICCLLACVFMNDSPEDSWLNKGDSDDESSEQETPHNSPRRPLHRARKQEKKKRR